MWVEDGHDRIFVAPIEQFSVGWLLEFVGIERLGSNGGSGTGGCGCSAE